jgi:YVTN family beta-propeller protein
VLYVENTRGGTITAVDVATREVLQTIDLHDPDPKAGRSPDDVVASHAGDVLYVSLMHHHVEGEKAPAIYDPGELLAIDPTDGRVLWRVALAGMPQHPSVSHDDRFVYQPIYSRDFLEVVDVGHREVVARIALGTYGSHGTRISPDGKRLYVGTVLSDRITVVDLASLRIERTIGFPEPVRPFCMTRDERTLFVQLTGMHGFCVVDLTTDQITHRVSLPTLPEGTKPLGWNTVNHGMNITSDDALLFAAGSVAGYVCVYSVALLRMVAKIDVGRAPNWVIFSRDGRYCFVSNSGDDTVSVISVADLKEIDRVRTGAQPQRMTTALRAA